jgi:hypothetical protein
MQRTFSIAGFAVLSALLVAACADTDRPQLRGALYFLSGNYLAMLDLRDGSTSVVSNLGEVNIESLSGRNGHYLPGTRTLVYDDGIRIFVTERVRGTWEKTEVAEHRYNESVDIVPLSATRFIYRIGDGPFVVYDKTAARSIELTALESACRLDRALWFVDREEMLCQLRDADEQADYAFVGLDGAVGHRVPLSPAHDLRPLVFLPDQDVLLLTERWQGGLARRVNWGVWVYRFDTQEAYRLFDDQYLGDSVYYVPD